MHVTAAPSSAAAENQAARQVVAARSNAAMFSNPYLAPSGTMHQCSASTAAVTRTPAAARAPIVRNLRGMKSVTCGWCSTPAASLYRGASSAGSSSALARIARWAVDAESASSLSTRRLRLSRPRNLDIRRNLSEPPSRYDAAEQYIRHGVHNPFRQNPIGGFHAVERLRVITENPIMPAEKSRRRSIRRAERLRGSILHRSTMKSRPESCVILPGLSKRRKFPVVRTCSRHVTERPRERCDVPDQMRVGRADRLTSVSRRMPTLHGRQRTHQSVPFGRR